MLVLFCVLSFNPGRLLFYFIFFPIRICDSAWWSTCLSNSFAFDLCRSLYSFHCEIDFDADFTVWDFSDLVGSEWHSGSQWAAGSLGSPLVCGPDYMRITDWPLTSISACLSLSRAGIIDMYHMPGLILILKSTPPPHTHMLLKTQAGYLPVLMSSL